MPLAKRRVRFGEAALQAGFIESGALEKALSVQKERDQQGESHKLLGIILLEMGAISSEHLIEILKVMNGSARLPSQGNGQHTNGTQPRRA
jgi:hypothetical protein